MTSKAPDPDTAPGEAHAELPAAGDQPAMPEAAEAEHRLARRRRRRAHARRLRRRRRHLMSAAVIGVLVGIVGAAAGVVGAVSFVGTGRDDAAAQAEAQAEAEFLGICSAQLHDIDCGCLWRDARPAFLPDARDEVITLIADRKTMPLRVQRIRTERLLGPELAKMVWGAAYYCGKR